MMNTCVASLSLPHTHDRDSHTRHTQPARDLLLKHATCGRQEMNTTAVALAPELGNVVAARLGKLSLEVLETLQKDLVRLALVTGAGVALRNLAAMTPDFLNWRWRPEPPVIVGLVALVGSLLAAFAAHFGCVGGVLSAPSCLMDPAQRASQLGAQLAPTETEARNVPAAMLLVLRYPLGVAFGLATIIAIDHTDATVHLLDGLARGWRYLAAVLCSIRWPWANKGVSDARGRQGRDRRAARGYSPQMQQRKYRPVPLPPDFRRALSRAQRRDLEHFRRMAFTDPVRALRDCVRMLGWRACRALFL